MAELLATSLGWSDHFRTMASMWARRRVKRALWGEVVENWYDLLKAVVAWVTRAPSPDPDPGPDPGPGSDGSADDPDHRTDWRDFP